MTGERIALLLWRNNMAVASLAREIGKDRSLISLKMNNHRRWYLDELLDVAEVLDTTVGYLLGETNEDRRSSIVAQMQNTPTANDEGIWRAPRDSNPRPSDP